MKKIINITLGGIVFAIETDAYETLSTYLQQVKSQLSSADDHTEIISDIETAIAEKFVALGRGQQSAVTDTDVTDVCVQMGEPTDFSENTSQENDSVITNATKINRRLFRDSDDKVIAGVASGIAHYFAIDPVIVRIAFLIGTLINGIGLAVYAIFWLVMPIAKTTAEKYAMHGDPVTLKEITAQVKNGVANQKTITRQNATGAWGSIRRGLDTLFKLFGDLMQMVFRFVKFAFALGLMAAGIIGIIATVVMYSLILFAKPFENIPDAQRLADTFFTNIAGLLVMGSFFVVAVIAGIVMIVIGLGMLLKRTYLTQTKINLIAGVWFIALVILLSSAAVHATLISQIIQDINAQSDEQLYLDYLEDKKNGFDGFAKPPENTSSQPPATPTAAAPARDYMMCTDDVKVCSDGSFVSRSEPNCTFAACPVVTE